VSSSTAGRRFRRGLLATLVGGTLLAFVPLPSFALEATIRIDEHRPTLSPVAPPAAPPDEAPPGPAAPPTVAPATGSTTPPATTTDPGTDTPTTAAPDPAPGPPAAAPGQPQAGQRPAATEEVDEHDHEALEALAATPGRLQATAEVGSFRLIGVSVETGADLAEAPPLVRVRADGTWTEWQELAFSPTHGPDNDSAEARHEADTIGLPASEPIWVGRADAYELNVPGDATDVSVHLGRDDETRVQVTLEQSPAGALPGQPAINLRSSWGARAPKQTTVNETLKQAVVHHSVTTNAYGPSEVPSILRGIQSYHMDTNGWDDIAYNFAVDRFGTIWEGRGGGIHEMVQGGHTRGFNREAVGVVVLGDFTSATPSSATLNAVGDVIGWKAWLHDMPVTGSFAKETSGNDKYASGSIVTLPRVIGHRDVDFTACPGNLLYPQLAAIRSRAAATASGLGATAAWFQEPTATSNADGRLEVFTASGSGEVFHTWQTSPNGGWKGWTSLGGAIVGPPSAVFNRDGRLEVFAVADDDTIQHAWQNSPGGTWSAWRSLGGYWRDGSRAVATRNADGRLEVFVIDAGGTLQHTWQWTPGGAWSGWEALGGVTFTGDPAVGISPDGRLEIFARGTDGKVWHRWQRTPNGTWSAWTNRGGSAGGPVTVGTNADQRLELFTSWGGQVWHAWQQSMNGPWSGWTPLGGNVDDAATLHVARNGDGRLEVFARARDGALAHAWQVRAGGAWSGWLGMGGPVLDGVVAGRNADGRLEVFVGRSPDHPIQHAWQSSGSGGWSRLVLL
jgi:hypothetical protein